MTVAASLGHNWDHEELITDIRQGVRGHVCLTGLIVSLACLALSDVRAVNDSTRQTLIEPVGDEVVESFTVRVPDDVIAISHRGNGLIRPFPADIPRMSEPNLSNGIAILTKIRNATGEVVGFGAQLEVILEDSAASGSQLQATDWILVIPGRGTIYLSELERLGDFGRQVIQPVIETGQDWEGEFTRVASVGPRADGRGVITGGTFEFENLTGSFVEIQNYTRVSADGQLFTTTELRLFQSPPAMRIPAVGK
jgi:hypothetical protein